MKGLTSRFSPLVVGCRSFLVVVVQHSGSTSPRQEPPNAIERKNRLEGRRPDEGFGENKKYKQPG